MNMRASSGVAVQSLSHVLPVTPRTVALQASLSMGLPRQEHWFSSVPHLCPTLCDPHGLQDTRPPCPSPTPGVYSNSCPSSRWCHPTLSSSVVPFSCLSIMAFGAITSWQIDGETQDKQWQILFFWNPKSLQMVTAAMKLKDACSLEEKLWPT